MSYSISASKAKAIHDTAMAIIERETRERASKTEHLRTLRLAREAQEMRELQDSLRSAKSRSLKASSKALPLRKQA